MNTVGSLLILFGSLFMALAVTGILRFDDPLMKLQSASKGATAGMGLILLGTVALDFRAQTVFFALAMMGLIFVVSPTVSHVIAKSHVDSGGELSSTMELNELSGDDH